MPVMGLEPIRGCLQQILSLPRLPFRHTGEAEHENDNTTRKRMQADFMHLLKDLHHGLRGPTEVLPDTAHIRRFDLNAVVMIDLFKCEALPSALFFPVPEDHEVP